MIFSHRYPIVTPGKSNVCWSKTLRSFGGYAVRELFPAIFFRAIWETQCFKTTIWRWLFLPIYNDFGDIFLLGLPWFTVHHIRSSWYTIGRRKKQSEGRLDVEPGSMGPLEWGYEHPILPSAREWFENQPYLRWLHDLGWSLSHFLWSVPTGESFS